MNELSTQYRTETVDWTSITRAPAAERTVAPPSRDTGFMMPPKTSAALPGTPARRLASLAAAILLQAGLVAIWISTQSISVPSRHESLIVVDISTREIPVQTELPPPPPPLAPPQTVITMQMPDIAVDQPPPSAPSTAITAMVGAPAPAVRPDTGESYETVMLRFIAGNLRYPQGARVRRQQGTVYVRFAIDRRGRLLSSQIERSSRFTTLDEEGLALLQRSQPMPPPPSSIAGERIEMVMPILFKLR